MAAGDCPPGVAPVNCDASICKTAECPEGLECYLDACGACKTSCKAPDVPITAEVEKLSSVSQWLSRPRCPPGKAQQLCEISPCATIRCAEGYTCVEDR
jgi:hypothetical protein